MRIDCQTHVFPDEYALVLARNPVSPQVIPETGGYHIIYRDLQEFHLKREAYSISRKIHDMDAAGIDVSVLSVNMPGPEFLVTELAIEGARACNDFLAQATERFPDRFVGLACLPWQDGTAALAEMDRAISELGLRGIVLYSHIGGGPVDDLAYDPIYGRAVELGIPVVLHPCVSAWAKEIKDYSMIPMVGLMVDHSFAMLRLILGGVMERHPGLKILQPHCGGILPYLWGRIRHQTEVMGRGMAHLNRSPTEYYQRVYLDTVSPSSLALRYAYDFAGPDRLIFGSDHPWVSVDSLTTLVEEMSIVEADKAKIFGLNAQSLFGIG